MLLLYLDYNIRNSQNVIVFLKCVWRNKSITALIIDSYSSDFQSLEIALDFLESQKNKNKTVILSDIFQSGLSNEELFRSCLS
jgi:alanine racemase